MSAEALCLAGDAALIALAVAAAFLAKRPAGRPVVYGGTLLLSGFLLLVAIGALAFGGRGEPLVLPLGLPWVGARFQIDALSAFFLVVVNLAAAASSLYALGYGRHEHDPERVLPFFPAFLAGMNLVLIAADAYGFLLSWEFMSLASWALVMAHHREDQNARAGYVYLVMASFGTLTLLVAFALLVGPDGHYAFAAIRAAPPAASLAVLAFVAALIGAGSKAGLAPLHVWLPLAHPAAPSHVSALMSGAMTKVAVYAFIRVAFDLAGAPDWRLAIPVLIVGAASGFIGVLQALMDNDLKRILAYSTIENIGLIFVGLGFAYAFHASGFDAAAALAMTAALLHAFNHALFKSLLFFGAGAVLTVTGERRLNRLGGLLNRMPTTGLFMLVGAAAIAALPPLNGFVSEWMILQAVLLSPSFPQWTLKILAPAVGASVALTAALAAACFVRAFGIPFLGRPRSEAAANAKEVDRMSLTAMGLLAALCLLAGVFPGQAIDALAPATRVGRRRAHAEPVHHALAVDRSDRSQPQLLQRAPGGALHPHVGDHGLDRHPSLRLGRAQASARLGLRLSRSGADDTIHRGELQPADPPGVRPARLRGGGADRHAAPGRHARRPSQSQAQRPDLEPPLRAPDPGRRTDGRSTQPPAVSHHPAVPERGVRRAGRASDRARVMALIVDLVFQLLQMTLVILIAPLLTGVVRATKARLTRRRGPRFSSPIATSCGWRARRRSSPTAPRCCSVSRPTSSSRRPGSPWR